MTEKYQQKLVDLLNRVPGYTGYRAKEDRRDADRRVRDEVAAALSADAARVERVAESLAAARDITAVGPVGALATDIRTLADRVASASYGYGGLFSDRDVDETALDQLREFDAGLLARLDALEPDLAALESAPDAAARSAALKTATTTVRDLDNYFAARTDVIETGRASPLTDVSSPLDVLQPKPDLALAAPARTAAVGDAVSVAGKNFVVDATIEVTGNEPATLVRIATVPERWLLLGAGPDPLVADLALDEPAEKLVPTAPISASQARVSGLAGSSGERSVSFAVTRDGPADRPVQVALAFVGGDSLHLAGTVLDPSDVEVYNRQP